MIERETVESRVRLTFLPDGFQFGLHSDERMID